MFAVTRPTDETPPRPLATLEVEEPLPSIMHLVPGPQVLTFQNILPDLHAHLEGNRSLVLCREMTPWPNSSREGVYSGSRVLSLGPQHPIFWRLHSRREGTQ